jgi:hypothetical protein
LEERIAAREQVESRMAEGKMQDGYNAGVAVLRADFEKGRRAIVTKYGEKRLGLAKVRERFIRPISNRIANQTATPLVIKKLVARGIGPGSRPRTATSQQFVKTKRKILLPDLKVKKSKLSLLG